MRISQGHTNVSILNVNTPAVQNTILKGMKKNTQGMSEGIVGDQIGNVGSRHCTEMGND